MNIVGKQNVNRQNDRIVRLIPTLCLSLVFIIAAVAIVFAHDSGLSAAVLMVEGTRVDAHLTFSRFDIETLIPLDADHNGKLTRAEFEQAYPQLQSLAAEAIEVKINGLLVPTEVTGIEPDDSDGVHFRFWFAKAEGGTFVIESKLIGRLSRGHRQYLEMLNGAEKMIGSRLLEAGSNTYEPSAAVLAEAAETPQTFWEFFKLGIEHIVTGFDHLAFLFALLLAGSSLKESAGIITSFTIAHSITLGLATFNVINLPSSIVEPMIAVSIVYVGLENIFRREVKMRWLLTFAFGLIHGFGFASVLRELGIGQAGGSAIIPLFSFNLGVETGQIVIAALVLPLIWKLKKLPDFAPRYAPAFSVLIALAGGYWLVERTLLK